MALLTNINGIPLYSTQQEALNYAAANGLTGFHTHSYQGQIGYMGGIDHNNAITGGVISQNIWDNSWGSITNRESTPPSGWSWDFGKNVWVYSGTVPTTPSTPTNTTIYQTDWDIVGLKIRVNNDAIFQIPLKRITKGGNRFWFGSFPISNNTRETLTVVSNDLRGKVYLYNTQGNSIGELGIGESITINNNLSIQVSDFITSTGLQIKSDPGIIVTYSSFLLLMISVYVSFLTYSQLWCLEKKEGLSLGGTSNRAVLFFQDEFRKIIKRSA